MLVYFSTYRFSKFEDLHFPLFIIWAAGPEIVCRQPPVAASGQE